MDKNKIFLSKETLTERYYIRIYAYCARRLPDRDAAEDTAQEVFAAFWEGPEFTDENVALGWLFRVAKSRIADFYRERQRRMEHESDLRPEDLPDGEVPRTTLFEESDDAADPDGLLGDVVGAMTEKERILFRKVWGEKIPYPELAAQYGITEGALRTRISRLKKKITARIRSLMPRLFPVLLLTAAVKVFWLFSPDLCNNLLFLRLI